MVDKSSAPAFSMGSPRHKVTLSNQHAPGPGAYDSLSSFQGSKQGNSVKPAKARFKEYDTFVPGPGTYNDQLNVQKQILREEKVPQPLSYREVNNYLHHHKKPQDQAHINLISKKQSSKKEASQSDHQLNQEILQGKEGNFQAQAITKQTEVQ